MQQEGSGMKTADTATWKELLMKLKSVSAQNAAVLQEIEGQMKVQRQRRAAAIAQEAEGLAAQKKQLDGLLADLDEDQLFAPEEQADRAAMQDRLLNQLEATETLLKQAGDMLNSLNAPVEEPEQPRTVVDIPVYEERTVLTQNEPVQNPEPVQSTPANGIMKRAMRAPNYPASQFRKEVLLGNWLCYVKPDQIVCQSFWADGVFREYEFTNGALTAETEGRYLVENGKVFLNRHRQKSLILKVQAFDEDVIDYTIEGQKVRFQYLPEDDLNHYLDQVEAVPVHQK